MNLEMSKYINQSIIRNPSKTKKFIKKTLFILFLHLFIYEIHIKKHTHIYHTSTPLNKLPNSQKKGGYDVGLGVKVCD